MANCLRAAVVTLDVCASFEITAGSVGSAGLAVSRHPVKIDLNHRYLLLPVDRPLKLVISLPFVAIFASISVLDSQQVVSPC